MTIGNLNPNNEIGASAWFVEMGNNRILLDCGLHPGILGAEARPCFDLISNERLDAIAITHCHQDHCGSIPVAMQYFPSAAVLMTELSYHILPRILHNSVNVMKYQAVEKNIPEYPLYTHEEVMALEPRFQGFRYNREIEWISFSKTCLGIESPTLEFIDAGHTLGSAGILLRSPDGGSLFYTGDCCLHDQTLLRKARFDNIHADVLLMETTRGDHANIVDHKTEMERLGKAIIQAQKDKRSVLIPVFALGRTQEILTELALLMGNDKILPQKIYIGGLGRHFTDVYDLTASRTNRNYSKLKFGELMDLQTIEPGSLSKIRLSKPHIFVLTAGMMNENTPTHDLALRFMKDPELSILFVGYAAPDSPAGRLKAAVQGEPFFFSEFAKEVVCHCKREDFDLTGHSYRDELIDLVGNVSPKTVILTHGSPDAKAWIQENIRRRYPDIQVLDPQPKEFITIEHSA